MDAFWLAVVIAVIAFVLQAVLHLPIKAWLATIGALSVFLPFALMALFGVFEMHNNPENAQAIADTTTASMIDRFGNNLPDIIIGDLAGAFVGGITGLFVSQKNQS